MTLLHSLVIASTAVSLQVADISSHCKANKLEPVSGSIIATNETEKFSKRKLKPYAGFPEIWHSASSKYHHNKEHQRIQEESKWARKIFNEVSKRYKVYKTKYNIKEKELSCRVLYRIDSDKNISVAFKKRSSSASFDSFLNGIFKSLKGDSYLAFPEYIEKIESESKRKCVAVSFEYNIRRDSKGELVMCPVKFFDSKPSGTAEKRRRMMIKIDNKVMHYAPIQVRYYFK